MVKRLRTIENGPSNSLSGLGGRSVSPGKLTNEKPGFKTVRAVRAQLVDLICKRRT